jgi:WD40 repeat protein
VGADDETVLVLDRATWAPKFRLHGHSAPIQAFSFIQDKLITGDWDGTVRVWSLQKGTCEKSFKGYSGEILAMALSPDGKTLAVCGVGGVVRMYSFPAFERLDKGSGHEQRIRNASFSPNGSFIVTAGEDRTIRTWRAKDGEQTNLLNTEANVLGAFVGADNRTLVTSCEDGSVVSYFDGKLTGKTRAGGGPCDILRAGYDPTTYVVVCCLGESRVQFRSLPKHDIRHVIEVEGGVTAIATTGARQIVAIADGNKILRLIDADTMKERGTVPLQNRVFHLAFSHDGKYLLASHLSQETILVECCTLRTMQVAAAIESIRDLTFIDHRLAAFGCDDGRIRIFDVFTGRPVHEFKAHGAAVSRITTSPDGSVAISAGDDLSLACWNTKQLIRDIQDKGRLGAERGHDSEFEHHWSMLRSDDLKLALQSMAMLLEMPGIARSVRPRIQVEPGYDAKKIGAAIAALGDKQFVNRSRAMRDLEEAGDQALPFIKRRLLSDVSAEERRALNQLSDNAERLRDDRLRIFRVIQILEYVGTSDAVKTLRDLSDGPEHSRITQEARLSVRRLEQK